jgi:hypothetical protein
MWIEKLAKTPGLTVSFGQLFSILDCFDLCLT